jgi:hypothetical protein
MFFCIVCYESSYKENEEGYCARCSLLFVTEDASSEPLAESFSMKPQRKLDRFRS